MVGGNFFFLERKFSSGCIAHLAVASVSCLQIKKGVEIHFLKTSRIIYYGLIHLCFKKNYLKQWDISKCSLEILSFQCNLKMKGLQLSYGNIILKVINYFHLFSSLEKNAVYHSWDCPEIITVV